MLVTGATGLLGAAAAERLAQAGLAVTAATRGEPPPAGEPLRLDLARPGALDGAGPFDAVVHTAAALPRSLEDSAEAAEQNDAIDAAVLDAAVRWGAHVVYTSGTSLYADGDGAPLAEDAPLAPRGAYLEQKRRTEELGREQASRTGATFTVLRVSAPYGPHQRARTVLRTFVERARAGEPLEYHGTGTREQDFTWAGDVADAIALALARPDGTYNVVSGEPTTMRALAELVAGLAGLPEGSVRASGKGDPQEGALARYDASAAHERLGWEPRTPLREGVARMLEVAP